MEVLTGVKVGDKRCDREEGEIGKWQVVREVKILDKIGWFWEKLLGGSN